MPERLIKPGRRLKFFFHRLGKTIESPESLDFFGVTFQVRKAKKPTLAKCARAGAPRSSKPLKAWPTRLTYEALHQLSLDE